MDFVAIDFETANRHADSACQLAAVVVRDSQIVAEHSWLIRPAGNYFSSFNISVHGIRPADVIDSPTMDQVWPEFWSLVADQTLVAHNARFDIGVLVASLAAYDIACPQLEYTCTRLLSQIVWPGRERYGLKPLGQWLGIEFKHHDALEDARCCASIILAIQDACGVPSGLAELEAGLRVSRGCYRHGRLVSPRRLDRSRKKQSQLRALQPSCDRAGFPQQRALGGVCVDSIRRACDEQPLAGKFIVMLGPLRGLNMQQSVQLVTDLGAQVQQQIDGSTHYVVACGAAISEAQRYLANALLRLATPSGQKHDSAAILPPDRIRVLSERQFRALVPGAAADRW
ncbi:MAG: 3'-5' exoribonuclease [Pirellulaceae bacterium]|nr:3'-5' exoribonuclease [Pirellulaceae bacterium]